MKVGDDVKTLQLLQNLDNRFDFGQDLQNLLSSDFNAEIEDVLNDVKDAFYTDNFYDQDDYLSYFWNNWFSIERVILDDSYALYILSRALIHINQFLLVQLYDITSMIIVEIYFSLYFDENNVF